MAERLQKVLSQWGVASRRRAEQLMAAGRVQVNGRVPSLGQKVDPTVDVVTVDGQVVTATPRPLLQYWLLNKPLGMVSTCFDPQGRRTVLAALPPALQDVGLHPVGRLDRDSTGALLLTNDGALTHWLTHPRHDCAKTYQVWVAGRPSYGVLMRWRQGVLLDGRPTRPADVTVLGQRQGATLLQVVLKEGRNRQIRRVAAQLGHPVQALERTALGPIALADLPSGQVRPLTEAEVTCLGRPPLYPALVTRTAPSSA